MGEACRSPYVSPARIGTTRKKPWRWSMRFPRCTANGGDRDGGQTVCSGIAATTQPPFGVSCGRSISRALVAMRRTKHGSGLGRWRWVVERTFAWLNQFRRLRVRYDKRPDIHEAFLSLGCALICWQSLRKTWSAPEADAILPGAGSPNTPFFSGNPVHAAAWKSPGGASLGHRSTLRRLRGLTCPYGRLGSRSGFDDARAGSRRNHARHRQSCSCEQRFELPGGSLRASC